MIFSNAVIFEINTVLSSLFWYHLVLLTVSVILCYLCIFIAMYMQLDIRAMYVTLLLAYVCTMFQCKLIINTVQQSKMIIMYEYTINHWYNYKPSKHSTHGYCMDVCIIFIIHCFYYVLLYKLLYCWTWGITCDL